IAKARQLAKSWERRRRRRRHIVARPDLTRGPLFVEHVEPLETKVQEAVDRGVKELRSADDEVPRTYVTYFQKTEAEALPKNVNVIEIFWREHGRSINGIRLVRVKRINRVLGVTDPRTQKRYWIVGYWTCYGTRINLRRGQMPTALALLH